MAILDKQKPDRDCGGVVVEEMSLREERKRTGRYVAAGTAIFLSLLGVYQALINGTPEYAALFAPVVIMFAYLLWILRSSKSQNARLSRLKAEILRRKASITIELLPENMDNEKRPNDEPAIASEPSSSFVVEVCPEKSTEKKKRAKQYNRSYSVA